jgi:diguanylate cyclase (GGDEF)-like protein
VRKGRRRQDRFSVLFVDLDHFKEVNDTLGHAAGDQLLQAVAERLTSAVRQSDLVARMGGDEFVVLVEDHHGPEEVMIVAQKILALLERPVLIDWREVKISGSVGIASFPEDGEDLDTLMKNADIAMYQAKERGRNNFQFFSADLNRMSVQRRELERRVRSGLERQEFFLQYQPEVSLATGRIEAVEALLRWKDPDSGVILPAEFLPSAEENGTIIAIGEWVLDRALSDAASWRERGVELPVSINVSGRQLHQSDFAAVVERALRAHNVPPASLRLEIPETALMVESEKTDRGVRALHALGVKIAIDNFGTGYSSLGLVRGFAVNAVKIDRSLVSSCENKRECAAIVQAVGAMARNLGIVVVASGVESEDDKRIVASLGCDRAQGMHVGKPMDWAALAKSGKEVTIPAE